MAKELRALSVIVSVGMLIYLASLGNVSLAEVGSAAGEGHFDDTTISIEACVVRIAIEALEEGTGDSDFLALSSISADKILSRVGADDAEVVSGVKILVGNGAAAEMSAEDNAREKQKNPERETGEHSDRKTSVSFKAQAMIRAAGRIAVEFSFKQLISESGSSGSSEGEREEEAIRVFEVSSKLGLQVGRPHVAGARRNGDEAMFLILYADI